MFTTNTTADFKFTINFGGTLTSIRYISYNKSPNLTPLSSFASTSTTVGTTQSINATSNGDGVVDLRGSIIVGNTGGTLGFAWAQDVSNVGNTTVYKNSYGLLMKSN